MKPNLPVVYSLKGSDFSLLYVSSRITIGNYISNLKFVHFSIGFDRFPDIRKTFWLLNKKIAI